MINRLRNLLSIRVPFVMLPIVVVLLLIIVPTMMPSNRVTVSDASCCRLNIRNFQVGVRSWQNMESKEVGDPIVMSEIVGEGEFMDGLPVCPTVGVYTFLKTIPEKGIVVMSCSEHDYVPSDTSGW